MTSRRHLAAVALLLAAAAAMPSLGCGTALGSEWFPNRRNYWDQRIADLDKVDRPAVYLKRQFRYLLSYTRGAFTETQEHSQVRILNEAGLSLATVVLPSRKGSELTHFEARTLNSDGSITEVEDARILRDTDVVDGEERELTKFRVPDVQVGDTIEYSFTWRSPGIPFLIRGPMAGPLPTVEYDMQLEVNKDVEFEVRKYNTDGDMKLTRDGMGGFRVTMQAHNIPASESEDLGPDGTLADPWWVFGVKSLDGRRTSSADWGRAMYQQASRIYDDDDGDFFDGYKPDVDVGGCDTDRCRAGRALAWVGDTTEFGHSFEEWWQPRPMSSVVSSGRADAQEKNYLLFAALKELGLTPKLAAVNRYMSRGHDFDFPSRLWFNHQVVVLEELDGKAGDLVLDASCQWCRVGELPWWSRDADALVYEPRFGVDSTQTRFITLRAPEPRSQWLGNIEVEAGLDGRAHIRFRERWEGESSLGQTNWWRRHTGADLEQRLERDLKRRLVAGELGDQDPLTCEPRQARCTEGYEVDIDGLGVLTPTRWAVPLVLMRSSIDNLLQDDVRIYDLFIPYSQSHIETVEIRPPPGYVLDERPRNERLKSDAFTFELSIEVGNDGATIVRRRLDRHRGRHDKSRYQQLRAPLRRFADVRRHLVVFRKR